MTTITAFVKRHPVAIYFALACAISWGIVLLIIGGPDKILVTREQIETLLPFVILAMLPGPSIAGILMTGLVHGRAGFRELLSRLLSGGWVPAGTQSRSDRPASGDGNTLCAAANLAGISPRHNGI